MDQEKLRTILQIGETIAVEFKRCSNRIENDVYQSVCSFLNRFGGDIYLGEYSYAEEPTMSDRWLNQSKIIHFERSIRYFIISFNIRKKFKADFTSKDTITDNFR